MGTLTIGNLLIGTYHVGKVSVEYLQADRCVYPRLRIGVNWELHDVRGGAEPLSPRYALTGVTGQLWLAESARVVGTIHRVEPAPPIWSSDRPVPSTTQLVCDLDFFCLEAIEAERNGRVPRFMLDLWPIIVSQDGPVACQLGRMTFEVPRDEWVRTLELMRDWRIEVIEVRYPPSSAEPFERAFANARKARTLLDVGHFDDAAAASRRVIEALQVHYGVGGRDEENGWAAFFTTPGREKVAVEYGKLFSATKKLAGYAIHELKTPPPNYSRAEATAVVRLAETLASIVADLAPKLPRAQPKDAAFRDGSQERK